MSVEIVVVNKKNLKHFINLPFKLYKKDPHWIGELKMDTKHLLTKDPFWNHATKKLFIAKREGKVVGRIGAFINHTHNEYWREHTGMFGFFESIDDAQVSNALFNAAKNWLKEKGMQTLRGPFNPSTNHPCGLLAQDFSNDPFIMMPYNFPYYQNLIEKAGLVKVKDLLAFERSKFDKFSPRFEKIIERATRHQKIVMRPINLKNIKAEALMIRDIFNKSWAQNWGFLPISEAEIMELAKQLKLIVDPRITCVAEIDGVPAGFYLCIPDMNRVLQVLKGVLFNPVRTIKALWAWKKIDTARLIMLGVLPEYRQRGIDLALIKHIVQNGPEKGYWMAELSWMLEDNKSIITAVTEAGCREMKRRYRVFETAL